MFPTQSAAGRSRSLGVVLAAVLLLAGCGPSERERVERAASKRWRADSATCTRRSERLYGCVLVNAHIPRRLQFTDDFLSSKQHRCFRVSQTVADVSTTTHGYMCAFGHVRPARPAPVVLSVEVTFKCEDEERGQLVGPAIIYEETTKGPRTTEPANWVTLAEAKAIARRLHARYTEDC